MDEATEVLHEGILEYLTSEIVATLESHIICEKVHFVYDGERVTTMSLKCPPSYRLENRRCWYIGLTSKLTKVGPDKPYLTRRVGDRNETINYFDLSNPDVHKIIANRFYRDLAAAMDHDLPSPQDWYGSSWDCRRILRDAIKKE